MYVYIDRHETLPFNTDIMFLLAPNVCQDRYLFFQYVSATYYVYALYPPVKFIDEYSILITYTYIHVEPKRLSAFDSYSHRYN